MKKQMSVVLCLVLTFSLAACDTTRGIITHPYVQEYVAGQGNIKGDVDVSYFLERDERFEIGATKDGYAVFKNPDEAYEALLEKYSDGLDLIKEEMKIEPISKEDYQEYKTYGWQVTTGSKKAQEEAYFVSAFFDIYENSFDE